MSSQAQIDANRLNSQKSTGPTSPEGKAASSLNALKSGIHAASHIIYGEDPAELEALTAAFLLEFQPADPNQLPLVDTLIAAEWTQRRLRRIEAELWIGRHESRDPTHAALSDTPPTPIQFPTLGDSSPDALDPFIRIQRRIDGTNRMYLRTLQVLQALQKPVGQASWPVTPIPEQACQPAAPAPQPAPAGETRPLTPSNGFFRKYTQIVENRNAAAGRIFIAGGGQPVMPISFRHSLLRPRNGRTLMKIANLIHKRGTWKRTALWQTRHPTRRPAADTTHEEAGLF